MLVNQIGNKLDMKCRLYINGGSYIFRVSSVHNMVMPVFLKQTNDGLYLKVFIEKGNIDPVLKNVLHSMESEERNNHYILTEKAFDNNVKELLDKLCEIPSLILGEPSIERGKLIIRFRFHHNYNKAVSDVLSLKIMKPLFIDKIEYRPAEDILTLLMKKNQRTPISVIKYKIPVEAYEDKNITDIIKKHNAIVEIIDSYKDLDYFNTIVFSSDKIDGLQEIADNMYAVKLRTIMLEKLREKANNTGIYRDNIFGTVEGNYIIMTAFLSSFRALDYTRMLFSNSYELAGKNTISLDIVRQLGDDILKYL